MMDIERAKKLLTILADGVNPLTGEVLADDDSCNHIEIVRALNTVLREITIRPRKSNKGQPENAGKPWLTEDDAELCRMFDSGVAKREICNRFKRSDGGIAARLVKLGKIQDRDTFRNMR